MTETQGETCIWLLTLVAGGVWFAIGLGVCRLFSLGRNQRHLLAAAFCLLVPAVASAQMAGVVSYYPLDGSGVDTASGYNLAAGGTGGNYISGQHGQAFHGGTSGRLVASAVGPMSPPNMTVECWLKFGTSAGNFFYAGNSNGGLSNGYGLYRYNSQLRWFVGSASPNAYYNSGIDDTWYHVVGTYDEASLKLYINGALVSSVAKTGAYTAGGGFSVGASSTGAFAIGARAVDNVVLYSRALSPSEVATRYADCTGSGSPDPTFQPAPNCDGVRVYRYTYSESLLRYVWSLDSETGFCGGGCGWCFDDELDCPATPDETRQVLCNAACVGQIGDLDPDCPPVANLCNGVRTYQASIVDNVLTWVLQTETGECDGQGMSGECCYDYSALDVCPVTPGDSRQATCNADCDTVFDLTPTCITNACNGQRTYRAVAGQGGVIWELIGETGECNGVNGGGQDCCYDFDPLDQCPVILGEERVVLCGLSCVTSLQNPSCGGVGCNGWRAYQYVVDVQLDRKVWSLVDSEGGCSGSCGWCVGEALDCPATLGETRVIQCGELCNDTPNVDPDCDGVIGNGCNGWRDYKYVCNAGTCGWQLYAQDGACVSPCGFCFDTNLDCPVTENEIRRIYCGQSCGGQEPVLNPSCGAGGGPGGGEEPPPVFDCDGVAVWQYQVGPGPGFVRSWVKISQTDDCYGTNGSGQTCCWDFANPAFLCPQDYDTVEVHCGWSIPGGQQCTALPERCCEQPCVDEPGDGAFCWDECVGETFPPGHGKPWVGVDCVPPQCLEYWDEADLDGDGIPWANDPCPLEHQDTTDARADQTQPCAGTSVVPPADLGIFSIDEEAFKRSCVQKAGGLIHALDYCPSDIRLAGDDCWDLALYTDPVAAALAEKFDVDLEELVGDSGGEEDRWKISIDFPVLGVFEMDLNPSRVQNQNENALGGGLNSIMWEAVGWWKAVLTTMMAFFFIRLILADVGAL